MERQELIDKMLAFGLSLEEANRCVNKYAPEIIERETDKLMSRRHLAHADHELFNAFKKEALKRPYILAWANSRADRSAEWKHQVSDFIGAIHLDKTKLRAPQGTEFIVKDFSGDHWDPRLCLRLGKDVHEVALETAMAYELLNQ